MKIKLFIKDLELGVLEKVNSQYKYVANDDNVRIAKQKYMLDMVLYTLIEKGVCVYDQIPDLYNQYLECTNRQDIIEKTKIDSRDNDFSKLYKVASLSFANTFYLKQA